MAKTSKKPASHKREADRLKLNVPWGEAAKRLLNTPAGSTPKRQTKVRKKSTDR